jgi:hypothetical protein
MPSARPGAQAPQPAPAWRLGICPAALALFEAAC